MRIFERYKMLRCVIIGPPGSGKATISQRIKNEFQINYIGSGDMLRSHVLNKTGNFFVTNRR